MEDLWSFNGTEWDEYFNNFFNRTEFWTYHSNDGLSNLQRIVRIVVPTIFGFVFLVGFIGNSLVVIAVVLNPRMRSTPNFMILNLAITDLLFIIICVPFTASDYVLPYWPFGLIWCKIVQCVVIVSLLCSVLTLMLMSAIRFLAVVFPLKPKSIFIRRESSVLKIIGVIWITSIAFGLPSFFVHGIVEIPYGYKTYLVCTMKPEYEEIGLHYQLAFFLFTYAIPLAVTLIFYICILVALKNKAFDQGLSSDNGSVKTRASRMIVIVTIVFALCWLPIQVVLLLKQLNLYYLSDVTIATQITAHVLGYMNSCVNPIMYAWLSATFRNEFKRIAFMKWNFQRTRTPLQTPNELALHLVS